MENYGPRAVENGGEGMRDLNLGTSELVEGFVEDRRKNDLTAVKDVVELAFTPDSVDEAPDTGWALRDSASQLNSYTLIAGRVHPADTKGIFKLWGKWSNPPEEVKILIGRFRVV